MIELPMHYGKEILRVEVGSTLHGTGLGVAHEDHDEMGIYVEWPHTTIGLGSNEHYTTRTAPNGERSGPGDTDLVCYSLRKWAKLAMNGNPSVLLPLFAPEDKFVVSSDIGRELRSHADWFASKRAGKAFLGYMQRQRMRMTGERGRAGRVRVLADGAIDWKYAMHMLRLGFQGREFLSTGRITVPVPGDIGSYLRSVRQGHIPIEKVTERAAQLEIEVTSLMHDSFLPDQPDSFHIEQWVVDTTLNVWHGAGIEAPAVSAAQRRAYVDTGRSGYPWDESD